VVGIEPSPGPVAALRDILEQTHRKADIIRGFIEDVPLPGSFDLVIFSWYTYGYVRQSSRRVAVLKRVASHLSPGGRIVLTYVTRSDLRQARGMRIAEWVARATGSDWLPEEHDLLAMTRGSKGNRLITYEHLFTPGEIEREAALAGLQVISRDAPTEISALLLGL
jgi:SAM-dependent methyltransferase